MHTYNDRPCSACGDLNGCHVPDKVKRCSGAVKFMPGGVPRAGFGQESPRIVCLCGSTRFGDAFRDALRSETLEGNIVLSVGLLGHAEGIDMDGPVKVVLDELHKRKIDHADEILVLNCLAVCCDACGSVSAVKSRTVGSWVCPCGHTITDAPRPYIGKSTRGEIEYAKATGKKIRYLEPIPEDK